MSEIKLSDSDKNVNIRMEKRDGETYVALGLFIVVVGIPVMAGTYWAAKFDTSAAIVNFLCIAGHRRRRHHLRAHSAGTE